MGEVAGMREADRECHFGDAEIAALEQGSGSLHAAAEDVPAGCDAQSLFERAEEVKGAEPGGGGQVGEGDGVVEVVVDEGLD